MKATHPNPLRGKNRVGVVNEYSVNSVFSVAGNIFDFPSVNSVFSVAECFGGE
jgi:hypothetical protein